MTNKIQKNNQPRRERLELLFDSLVSNQLLILAAGLILLFAMVEHKSLFILLTWGAILLVSILYRVFLKWQYDQHAPIQTAQLGHWENRYLFGILLSAVVWGSAGWMLFVYESMVHQTMLELTLAVICIVALRVLSPMKRGLLLFLPIVVIPITIHIVNSDSPIGGPMALLVVLYMVVSFVSGIKFNKHFKENQQLRFEAIEREQQLQESEEKYRLLYEKSEDPMLIIADGKLVMVNQATVDLFGYANEQEMLTINPFFLTPEMQHGGVTSYEKALATKAIVEAKGYCRFEWLYKKKDQQVYPADITLTAIPFGGKPAIFCILRDISESKKIEQELIQAQQKADSANQAKSVFLANMSHEIRTPMNGILGTLDLMLQNPLPADQKERARIIQNSADSLMAIINDILDISKIEAGKLTLDDQPFNLQALMAEFAESIQPGLAEKSLSFQYEMESLDQQNFIGDAGRIRQILHNLVGNAIKFTDKGFVFVDAQMIWENAAEALLKFNIKDTGIGIPEDLQENLFNRFTQADDSTTRKYSGTGLGLNICQQLARLMGGEVGVNSKPKQGSHFWFTVRLEKPDQLSGHDNPKPASEKQQIPMQGHILVVDDNETNQYVANGVLETLGMSVTLADDGAAAVKAWQNDAFDLIIMDCQMPIMDGYAATEKIRQLEAEQGLPPIPIIAMTASAMQGDREKCLAAGMNDYITKPIESAMVQQIISPWLLNHTTQSAHDYTSHKQSGEADKKAAVFDYAALYKRLAGDEALIKDIIHNFTDSMEKHIQTLKHQVVQQDYEAVSLTAHALVGSAATMACDQLSALALAIEQASKQGDGLAVEALIPKIESSFTASELAIRAQITEK
ncbi:hybrid sensor histidine kinase/response regulator [Marinicella meishanensis]|uniref:hybrid sensor histidine kinase/response regulator n=1 Tax=Marinicella meishanensis TaxID=2873263 RepID=UPI001CBD2390|nr:ATP-binding protein [Marinicella sp. NBU2979]